MSSDELYIGVCYPSPNNEFSDRENDKMLCNMLDELYGKKVMLMGDFNFPDVDWLKSHGSSSVSQQFVNCIDDGFLTHVTEGTCNGKILDLVFTSDAHLKFTEFTDASMSQTMLA